MIVPITEQQARSDLTSSRVPAGPVRPSLHDLLLVAVDRAIVELTRVERTDVAEIREQLGRIARLSLGASANGLAGGGSAFLTPTIGANGRQGAADPDALAVVPRHYVNALRIALLDEVARGHSDLDAGELARALGAMERANTEHSPGSHHDFARHLASADAVNAVVEIAHDMRSPLTSILFLVDTLRRGQSGPVVAVQERQLGLIYGAALGLNTLASDVIDAVRGGQRLVDGNPVPFSIAEVISGVCHTVQPISEEKGLPIHQSLAASDGRLGYPGAISRVLLNLMTNALKYTNHGCVSIGCSEASDGRVSFWVQDTGEGIPPHVMDMLFDGFRPSASGMRFSNAGLGLAICQNFLRAMGSRLEVESARETGTRFSFELELARA
jgi:signal transduction histidine kinase